MLAFGRRGIVDTGTPPRGTQPCHPRSYSHNGAQATSVFAMGAARRGVVAAALVASALPCGAFRPETVPHNGTNQRMRWAARPAIRWAISPDFCTEMWPRLQESNDIGTRYGGFNFSSCARLYAAVRQAFAEWQANTPTIRFVDVSARCESESLWRPIAEGDCIRGPTCAAQVKH